MALASALFAAPTSHTYELTPTFGGVIPEGNLDMDTQLTYGLRMGIHFEKTFFDQFELGYDRSKGVEYQNSLFEADINRYYGNLVKEYKMTSESALYTLVGIGYEDIRNEQFANKDSMFAQYGGGVKYWVSDAFALKAEVRHSMKFQNGDSNLFYSLGFVVPLDMKVAPPIVKEEPKAKVFLADTPKDSDGDGVKDDKDRCPNTSKEDVVDEKGCSKIIRLHVSFESGKNEIKKEYLVEIEKVAAFMKTDEAYRVILEGHTDDTGKSTFNQLLSEQRANAVAKALVLMGISAEKISTKGYGQNMPLAPNDTEAGRSENRRVDAKFKR